MELILAAYHGVQELDGVSIGERDFRCPVFAVYDDHDQIVIFWRELTVKNIAGGHAREIWDRKALLP